MLCSLLLASQSAQADCWFRSGGASEATITLPATLSVPSDALDTPPQWNSGLLTFANFNAACTGVGDVRGTLAAGIGAAVPGFTSVFATNVPGIGISVRWCNGTATCNPTSVPNINAQTAPGGGNIYNFPSTWSVQLVKTGVVTPGVLSVPGTTFVTYQAMPIARLTIAGSATVKTTGCQITPLNITVDLPRITKSDFTDASPTPVGSNKSKPFDISITCDPGVQVLYEIAGTQTGTGTNVLANSTGSAMARGIGVQLLQRNPGSTTVVPIGSYVTYGARTGGSGPVNIPLTATYYRTAEASGIVPGRVSVTATFTLLYQ
jgi:type 1 fimbria pilin